MQICIDCIGSKWGWPNSFHSPAGQQDAWAELCFVGASCLIGKEDRKALKKGPITGLKKNKGTAKPFPHEVLGIGAWPTAGKRDWRQASLAWSSRHQRLATSSYREPVKIGLSHLRPQALETGQGWMHPQQHGLLSELAGLRPRVILQAAPSCTGKAQ